MAANATVSASATANAFWEATLRAQCSALRAAGQTWTYDASRRLLAVLIEPRGPRHPLFEASVRNAMAALGDDWNLMIVTYAGDVEAVNALFPGSKHLIQGIPYDNLTIAEYSNLMTHAPFWESLARHADVVATFQTDVVFFRPIPAIFLAYDYAGANFFGARFVSPSIGGINGGFSLRRPAAMLECLLEVPQATVTARLGAPPNVTIPEDVYYTHACDLRRKHVPPVGDRKYLAIETEYYERPAAFHGFQHSADVFTMDQCRTLVAESPLLKAYAPS